MAGASNESGIVDDGNVWRFEWLNLCSERSDSRTESIVANKLTALCSVQCVYVVVAGYAAAL